MNDRLWLWLALGIGAPLSAAPLSPNAGAFRGAGVLNDHDGNRGPWQALGVLKAGQFSGKLAMALGGAEMQFTMVPGPAYMENGSCVLKGTNGRSRFELRGKCDSSSFGPGTISGYFDGDRSFNGEFSGALSWGKAAAVAPSAAVVPTAKLACGYRERIGGVVAGDLATYENRPSLMVFLQLTPAGGYRTNNSSGRFTRQGNAIRLVGGAYSGALGRLRRDNSGEPAVYFDLADNRRAGGRPIVDAWNTFCVRQH
jgi:hypothetical protein